MYPKTTPPSGGKRKKTADNSVLAFLETGQSLPLFQAGPMVQALAARCAREPHFGPIVPERIFFGADGRLMLRPETEMENIPIFSPFRLAMTAPEERLRQAGAKSKDGYGAAAVYCLCALFFCLLLGQVPADPAREGIVKRRRQLRDLAGAVSPALNGRQGRQEMDDAAHTNALFHLLDRGLRADPGRRFGNPAELLGALYAVEEAFDHAACRLFSVQGVRGALTGQTFPLAKRVLLGRAADTCEVAFPAHTPGVSRIHCRMELVWGSVLITDLHSRYGTFLDGERLKAEKPTVCPAGQEVWCGSGREAVKVGWGNDAPPPQPYTDFLQDMTDER